MFKNKLKSIIFYSVIAGQFYGSDHIYASTLKINSQVLRWCSKNKTLISRLFPVTSRLISLPTIAQEKTAWLTTQDNKNVQTVFYQGMQNSQTQATNYTGSHGFKASTREHVYSCFGIDIFFNVNQSCEIDEVILRGDRIQTNQRLTNSFMHWLSDHKNKKRKNIITSNEVLTNSVSSHSLNLNMVSIGQHNDMNSFKKKFATLKETPSIVFGVSRGSATAFNAIALHDDYNLDNVKMIILEGGFDSIPNLLNVRWGRFYNLVPKQLLASLTKKILPSFDLFNGPYPIQNVEKFKKNTIHIPVVFITSKVDKVVPYECTVTLAHALRDAGHTQVYLLSLDHSAHACYHRSNKNDRKKYLNFMHALYKKYDLPYSEAQALMGEELLDEALLK